jgi:hypothetical protein
MSFRSLILTGILLANQAIAFTQETSTPSSSQQIPQKTSYLSGFIRGGLYGGIDKDGDDKPYIPSAFADFGLKAEVGNGLNFKAYADLRFRYGVEFMEPVSYVDLREAWVRVNGRKWDLTAGQRIIKWGRADFTHPTSNLSPQNMISRSPDREDMDMGNILASFNWYPLQAVRLEADLVPFYRSSILIIDPVPLPENVTITQTNTLITDQKLLSYGLKADFSLRGIDMGLSWFDGYDPMPGIALNSFNIDLTSPVPIPQIGMETKPYKTKVAGLDFESSMGNLGFRGEAAWAVPYLSAETYEYVPLPEIIWVAGLEWSSGIWRVEGEYNGKFVDNYTPVETPPLIGTEPDYSMLGQLMSMPGFDLESFVRGQVGAFNRLYNYQIEKVYHAGGIRIECDLLYGKLFPSLFSLYNITSRDLLVIPEIRYKPADGVAITFGAEFFSGRDGSLYDIVDGFMNNIYLSFRADF